jgi:N-acyl-D-amino-acid deacylase
VTLALRGGTVYDGSGAEPQRTDVVLEGSLISEVAAERTGSETLDVSGLAVAPGFIDTHSHSDLQVLAQPDLAMKLRQGITLEVFGQDGISVAPVRAEERSAAKRKLAGLLGDFGVEWSWSRVGEYLERVSAARPASDFAYLTPHGALRQHVIGPEDRPLTPSELGQMQVLLGEALADGACGMSTGLIYPPCCYGDTAELIALGRVLAAGRVPLVVHMRSESDRILEAVDEMLTVGRESGCRIHISHLKIAGRQNWDKAGALVAKLQSAIAEGVRVTADQYPYIAGSTLLGAILPPWAHDGGTEATLGRLRDPEARGRLRAQMADTSPADWDNFWKWSGPEGILVADIPSGRHADWLGRSLADIAKGIGKDPFETVFDLLLEESMGVAMISFSQDEDVVERFLRLPFVNVCTDGLPGGRPHPRAYGTFPRVLGRYARDRKTLPLTEAIRKMTSLPARGFRFDKVGLVQAGKRANLVVFDPARVADRATFEEPAQFSDGIVHVIVGGQVVVRDGVITDARPGALATS